MERITPTLRLRISSRCESEDEFVTLFHPLSVGRVVFLPTSHPEVVGSLVSATVVLANGRVALSGTAEVVDPHAAGLATAGKRGMALRFDRVSDTSEAILRELHRPPPGTIPFGVPTGTSDADRMACEVQRLPDPPSLPGIGPVATPPGDDDGTVRAPAAPVLDEVTQPVSAAEPRKVPDPEPQRPAAPRIPVAVAFDPEVRRGPNGPKSMPPAIAPPRNALDIGPPRSAPAGEGEPIAFTDADGIDDLTDVVSPPIDDPLPSIIAAEPGALSTPEPLLPALPPVQPLALSGTRATSTEVLSSRARSRTIAIAAVAACLGVAGGWMLWKRNRPEAAAASATGPANQTNQARHIAAMTGEAWPEGAATAVAGDCHAEIASVPAGAAIFLDQNLIGAAPYDGPIPCGRAQVTLTLPSYESEVRSISPSEDDPTEIELELQRVRHTLRIVGTPRQAMVTIDGQKRGRLPLTVQIPAGQAALIEVDKRGYEAHKVKVVADESKKTVKVRLRKR